MIYNEENEAEIKVQDSEINLKNLRNEYDQVRKDFDLLITEDQ
jgi:hypothetical protein